MRRATSFALGLVLGVAVAVLGYESRPGRGTGYPVAVEVQQPGSQTPGRLTTTHRLRVVSANEDGWPIALGEGRPDRPSWKIKFELDGRTVILVAETE